MKLIVIYNIQILLTGLYRLVIVAVGRSCSCKEDNLRYFFKSVCVHAQQSKVIVTQSFEKRDSFRVSQRKAPLYLSLRFGNFLNCCSIKVI